tara:strand:- start:1090 stop:1287 length:198 start_codon:yes stop_codon:yes gene_type:complete
MKKKKSLYKYICQELSELNIILKEIDIYDKHTDLNKNIIKLITLKNIRENYFNDEIKPLMIIYQA